MERGVRTYERTDTQETVFFIAAEGSGLGIYVERKSQSSPGESFSALSDLIFPSYCEANVASRECV